MVKSGSGSKPRYLAPLARNLNTPETPVDTTVVLGVKEVNKTDDPILK